MCSGLRFKILLGVAELTQCRTEIWCNVLYGRILIVQKVRITLLEVNSMNSASEVWVRRVNLSYHILYLRNANVTITIISLKVTE